MFLLANKLSTGTLLLFLFLFIPKTLHQAKSQGDRLIHMGEKISRQHGFLAMA